MLTTGLEENVYGFNTHERTVNIPAELVCPPVGDLSTSNPTRKYSRYLRSRLNHSPVCLDAPNPIPPYAAGTLPHGEYDQPLTSPSLISQWSIPDYTPSVDKGKARATDHLPLHPASVGNDGE